MKKSIYVLTLMALIFGGVSMGTTLSFNNNAKVKNLTLESFAKTAYAQTEGCGEGCIPVDCPWYDPFCDDWDKSDPVVTYEYYTFDCVWQDVDCYPGTTSCTESRELVCEPNKSNAGAKAYDVNTSKH